MYSYRVAVLIASDKGAAGMREDLCAPLITKMVTKAGYTVCDTALLPDDEAGLATKLREWCHGGGDKPHLVLTSGGTGLSPRDCMPEATLSVAEKNVPGIAEAMRAYSLQITPRAMLSRAVAVVAGGTLVINLPGSPKAVGEILEYLLPTLAHGLDTLNGNTAECART